MKGNRRRDPQPVLAVRRAVHALGLRLEHTDQSGTWVAAGVLAEAEDHKSIRSPGQAVGRSSGRLKKWNAGRIRRTEKKLVK
jgi:hypothetical protein